jgi:nucleotidyltransferase/DNA polymerase involved in DNA repair
MPDQYGYSKQKPYEAMMSLCGTTSIQERLTFAALPLVILNTPAHENPDDAREELGEIVKRLTVEPLSNDRGYTPRKLSDEEANEIAQKILSLFVRVMGGL